MVPILLLFFFVLGTIVGSFLNVVVLRYGIRKQSGRSKCFSCGKSLRWFELLPVVSFLIQKGRCRGCKSFISWQYPLVELTTGLVFFAVIWRNLQPTTYNLQPDFSLLWWLVVGGWLLVWSLLIALSVYDFKHKIIPDGLVYSAALFSLLYLFLTFNFQLSTFNSLDFWAGFLFAAPFALIWFFSKGRAMGLGDAKLILLFPWLLGFAKGLSALIVGFWIGAAVASGALVLKAGVALLPPNLCMAFQSKLKHLGPKTEFPLGPFLVLGLFLVYAFGWDVTGLGMLLQASF